ncbi:M20/M25/M40 family metallo-hydrolase, partial [Vibrio cholerae O1]|nr:M20/M25/M40 family metallo-hydrolase [Vibrio cholerae O1]
CVAMRADIDGLPVKEASQKPYASTYTVQDSTTGASVPTMHACGHDFHIMSLLSALKALSVHKDAWKGTY